IPTSSIGPHCRAARATRGGYCLLALTSSRPILNYMVKYQDNLSQAFAALADPTRRLIIDRLARRSASVTDLAAGHEISLPAVLKHLNVLKKAGLIWTEKIGRVRRCGLQARRIYDASVWLDRYRALWEARFDRLDAHLHRKKGANS